MWHHQTDSKILGLLGEAIRDERVRTGLRQEDLAQRASIGLATVQRLERGDPVRTDTLIAVMRILQLLDRLEPAFQPPPEPPSPFDDDDETPATRHRVRRSREPGLG